MAFHDRLKEARIKSNYTQDQLAEILGIGKSTLSGYENGNREPTISTIAKIIDTLNIDANFLYQDEVLSTNEVSYEIMGMNNKYRELDEHGKKVVDFILNEESDRCTHEVASALSVEEQYAAAARDIRKYIGQIDVHDPDAGQKLEALIRGDHPESKQIG